MRARAGGASSADAWVAWPFLACAAGAFAAYVAGLALVARRPSPSKLVIGVGAAVQLVPLAAPLLLSTDAWNYWGYARIAFVHAGNPYVDLPAQFTGDEAVAWMGRDWLDTPSVYGPLFTLASEAVAAVVGASPAAAAWAYKSLAAAAIVTSMLLVMRIAARPALAAAFVGWNPVLAIHLAGGGHNDAWVAVLVVAALACGVAGRRQLAGVAWATAIFVKWVPLVLLPLRALEARATRRRVGHLGFAVAVAVIVALATWRYGGAWLRVVAPLLENAELTTQFSLPHRLEQFGVPSTAATALLAAAYTLAYVWLCVQAWRGRARLALAAALLLLATPYVAPWYLAWVVPLAAVEEDTAARVVTLGLTAYLLPQTVPV